MATEESIIRIPPYHYIHVLDQNSNVSRVEPVARGRSGW
uniref:Major vault protein n=1 Tax=Panthera tigris altaica TaxID=74533 RepID=A0A8C9JG95_PANTA